MFIYELFTLHQPFEGHESVKECILEGGRPPLTYRVRHHEKLSNLQPQLKWKQTILTNPPSFPVQETQYPSYMLDLMALCWSQQPTDRPSASQVVSISSAPEFTHLCDAVSLDHTETVVGVASTGLGGSSGEDGVAGAWLARGSTVDLLLASLCSWLQSYSLSAPNTLSAACFVPGLGGLGHAGAVWLGDTSGLIHAYSASDCAHLFSYRLDPDEQPGASVCCLLSLPALQRVAVALSNGRLFLVRSDTLPAAPTMAEGSFVMAELGSSSTLYSLTAVFLEDTLCELWCGEDRGNVSVYTIHDNVVTGHDVLQHPDQDQENAEVRHLVAATESYPCSPSSPSSVWSCAYPSSVVHQWDVETKTLVNKLDCSKLVPCSESLKSISIEEHLSPGRCQVTALAVQRAELYIGTTWGCVVVAERATLRPITVFRPFEEEVSAIVPLGLGQLGLGTSGARPESSFSEATSSSITASASASSNCTSGTGSTSDPGLGQNSSGNGLGTSPGAHCKGPGPGQGGLGHDYPLVATVGRGYRSLISRYTDTMPTLNSSDGTSGTSGTCVLLWRAQHWAVR